MTAANRRSRFAPPAEDAEVTIKSFRGPEVYVGPPGKMKLARDDSYWVTVTAPGYRERKVTITKSVSGWMFGNLVWILPILWGVGIGVDAMSGGLWTLGDDEIDVALSRLPPEPTLPAPPTTPPVPVTLPAPQSAPPIPSSVEPTPMAPAHVRDPGY